MSPHQILGISQNATLLQAKSAYRTLAKKYHPDVNRGSKNAEENFKRVNTAYQQLLLQNSFCDGNAAKRSAEPVLYSGVNQPIYEFEFVFQGRNYTWKGTGWNQQAVAKDLLRYLSRRAAEEREREELERSANNKEMTRLVTKLIFEGSKVVFWCWVLYVIFRSVIDMIKH